MVKEWAVALLLGCLGMAWANGLYVHPEKDDAHKCYLADAQGKRLFQGQYQNDCFAIQANQSLADDNTKKGHAVLNLFAFRGQKNVAINAQGDVLYHFYWYDNGPDYVEDGLVRMRNKEGLIGYADAKTGKTVIAPKYFCAQPFENGKALVGITGRLEQEDDLDGEMCVPEPALTIDKTGRVLR